MDLRTNVQGHSAILAGTLTGVQGDARCKVLASFSTVKNLRRKL